MGQAAARRRRPSLSLGFSLIHISIDVSPALHLALLCQYVALGYARLLSVLRCRFTSYLPSRAAC